MSDETKIVRLSDCASSPTPSPDALSGQLSEVSGVSIPGYDILEEVGRGGMGVVYKARQRSVNRLVALKVMLGGTFAGSTEKARFRMEAEALGRLRHPNVVQVYDVGEFAGVAYIAVEFVDGPTLRRWQNGQPIEPRAAASLVATVARAIQHAHDMGIVHRDLKPANILLQVVSGQWPVASEEKKASSSELSTVHCPLSTTTPKVSDFGLAKPLDGGAGITVSGVACGTPNYMAPEQVRGGLAGSRPPVDVWGLGAVLFELLTGRPPFVGADSASVMQEIALSDPPSVTRYARGVPYDLVVIVSKCLEKNPAHRYLAPGEVASDLERFLAGQPILARRVGAVARASRWVRRNPVPALTGVVLTVALLCVSAFAVALAQSVQRERDAREGEQEALLEESRLRGKADHALRNVENAKRDAEKARDDTRAALKRLEEALGAARVEKDRADGNLVTARRAVGHVLAKASTLSEQDDPALIPVYHNLLSGLQPFVETILTQTGGDPELRRDQATIALALGRLEALQGRPAIGREHLLTAVAIHRRLAEDEPGNPRSQFELGEALAYAGQMSAEARAPDAARLLEEARTVLEHYSTEQPKDTQALHELIRVRLSMIGRPGSLDYTDEHDQAVLDLVDRLTSLQGQTSDLAKIRAHALNNIASDMTNRDKTDEAEAVWLQVVAIRERLYKSQSNDRITRYELGKCLTNYANQLAKTGRGDQAFDTRERAAGIFDTLRDDARYRTTYILVMVINDVRLADEYARRKEPDKAIARLTSAISFNANLLRSDPKSRQFVGNHGQLYAKRAALHEQTKRHAAAAGDYRLAADHSLDAKTRDECLVGVARCAVELARAGDFAAAGPAALKVNPELLPQPAQCMELALVWLGVAQWARGDKTRKPAEREKSIGDAVANARTCVLAAEKKGGFETDEAIRRFHEQRDFEPIWDIIPRVTKK